MIGDLFVKGLELIENVNEEPQCKGIFFRGKFNSFYNDRKKSITVKKELVLLKRKSCKGCEQCDWIWDYIWEDCNDNPLEDYIGEIENGKLYTFTVHTSRDWESGYEEIDCITFDEIKEEK
jgi:hypothetical protein